MTAEAKKPYRIAFFGTSDFAVPALEALARDADFSVTLVVTQPDRPVGRKQVLTAPAVKRAAVALGLPVAQPESLKTEEAAAMLEKERAALFVVAAYGQILSKRVLAIPERGCVNVHGSLLPRYRGASPIAAAIAAGEKETGVTIMMMEPTLDTGPTLATAKTPVAEIDDAETLSVKLAASAAGLLGPTLKLYLEGHLKPVAQEHAEATMTKILSREDGRIDWKRSAEEIERSVRAMRPWPGAFTVWRHGGKELRVAIREAEVLHPETPCGAGKPGAVCRLADGSMGVDCGKGSLAVTRLQIEGKGETDGKSFLNGHPDAATATLG